MTGDTGEIEMCLIRRDDTSLFQPPHSLEAELRQVNPFRQILVSDAPVFCKVCRMRRSICLTGAFTLIRPRVDDNGTTPDVCRILFG